MSSENIVAQVIKAVIDSVKVDELDGSLERLRSIFPETTIVAALDLVDRACVIKYTSPWGRSYFEVLGSTATYTVFPQLDFPASASCYCTCPSFAFAVLMSESHITCKHILAIWLAEQLSRYVERPTNTEEFITTVTK